MVTEARMPSANQTAIQLNVLRIITLFGCVGVIVLCAFEWPFSLWAKALTGTVVLAVVQYLLVYACASARNAYVRVAGGILVLAGVIYASAFVACQEVKTSATTDDAKILRVPVVLLQDVLVCHLPEDAAAATMLALLDVLDSIAVSILAMTLYLGSRLHRWFARSVPPPACALGSGGIVMSLFFCAFGLVAFHSWVRTFADYAVPPSTLLPQTDTVYGKATLVAMVSTACEIVATADASKLMSSALEYLIVLAAASLDLSTTASIVALWCLARDHITNCAPATL